MPCNLWCALLAVSALPLAASSPGCLAGQTVYAAYDGVDVYEATVNEINCDGSIDVTFTDDGASQTDTSATEVFSQTNEGCGGPWQVAATVCSVGTSVWGIYAGDGYWYQGTVDSWSGNQITFDWGDGTDDTLSAGHVEVCDASDICHPCVDHCQCTGVSPPTCPGMSGDPIVHINGHVAQIELPMHTQTLLWDENGFAIYAKANLVTPDQNSQWFSEFSLVDNGHEVATIQRKEIHVGDQEQLAALNTLILTMRGETSQSQVITTPGAYNIMSGPKVTGKIIVSRSDVQMGHLRKEKVFVEANGISFTISPEIAKKFKKHDLALKYSHLDIQLHNMSSNVKSGVFAELWGFIPMKPETAKMIRSLRSTE